MHELNQLELHFLLLNDFRLTIPMAEIQQYADQLLAYGQDRAADIAAEQPAHADGQHAVHARQET